MVKKIFLFCFAIAWVTQALHAQLVVPNANELVEGNIRNRFPFFVNGGQRVQQVMASSQFATLASGGEFITGMAFRLDNDSGTGPGSGFDAPFSETINDVTISFSTTFAAPDGLSLTFADNIGGDVTTVLNDVDLTLSSSSPAGPGNTKGFDINIPFDTPFFYNPASGNLLMDVLVLDPANNDVHPGSLFDAELVIGTDPVSRLVSMEGMPTDATGGVDSLGYVIQFSIIPEPSTSSLLLLVGIGFLIARRR